MAATAENTHKIVVVGDGAVGKTSLIHSSSTGCFPTEYVPKVHQVYSTQVKVQDQEVSIEVWDTARQESYDRLRPLSYLGANAFLVCFSVVSPYSLEGVTSSWIPEVQHHVPGVPMVLVGTKIDLLSDSQTVASLEQKRQKPVSREQAMDVVKKAGMAAYFECSALKQVGIKEVFEGAAAVAITHKINSKTTRHSTRCLLL